MKKKLLLIITLGISFAPLAFAGDPADDSASSGLGEKTLLSQYHQGSTECWRDRKIDADGVAAAETSAAAKAKAASPK